jgi:hypothetical protein
MVQLARISRLIGIDVVRMLFDIVQRHAAMRTNAELPHPGMCLNLR